MESFPKYFKNSENPMICYKYKKPIRNIIFNYNKIVSDLDISANTPDNCNCQDSKFTYAPAGHVITGNFEIIDKRIRHLFSKGPKYRMPSYIDFDVCRKHMAESLEEFSVKWCRRENAEPSALSAWKKSILTIIDTRVKFYQQNTHLLPPKPRFTIRNLKAVISNFHSKFVLVPADKAANNIVIV